MANIAETIGDYESFLTLIIQNLESSGIDYSGFNLDHIAFRTITAESYQRKKSELKEFGTLLREMIIRDRPIAIYKLDEPITYRNFSIPYLELISPAVGDNFSEGLEHSEFVINETLDGFKKRYPNLDFIFKDHKINSELVLKFSNNANIKFHLKNIGEVVKLQENSGEL